MTQALGVVTVLYFFASTVLALQYNTSRIGQQMRDIDLLVGVVIVFIWLNHLASGAYDAIIPYT